MSFANGKNSIIIGAYLFITYPVAVAGVMVYFISLSSPLTNKKISFLFVFFLYLFFSLLKGAATGKRPAEWYLEYESLINFNKNEEFIKRFSLDNMPQVFVIYLLMRCNERKNIKIAEHILQINNICFLKLGEDIKKNDKWHYVSHNVLTPLIKKGVNPHIVDNNGNSLVHCGCQIKDIKFIGKLIEKGVHVNRLNKAFKTPLDLAIEGGNTDLIKFCRAKGAIESKTEDGFGLLHRACEMGDVKLAEQLINLKCDVNEENKISQTPLDLAVQNGNIKIVKLLVINGATINKKEKSSENLPSSPIDVHGENFYISTGISPLHIAAIWGHQEIVEYLIKKGAHINARTIIKQTPLQSAASSTSENRLEIVKLLIKKGAEIDAEDIEKRTAHTIAQLEEDKLLDEFFTEHKKHKKDFSIHEIAKKCTLM